MSKHLDFLFEEVERSAIRVSAEGFGLAVALTEDQLITAKAGIIRRWGKVERFPLSSLVALRSMPNPSANLLQIQFAEGSGGRVLTIMYPPESSAAFDQIIGFLQGRLAAQQSGDAHER